ncbi:hypothetical protein B0H13DRAFT_2316784 [Mycena leptocephala]|nr:hypothetical protein B0H13DRAFT_2316784 [Mycena leptocephala]
MSADINTKKFTGPLFVGAILTWALLGSLTIQLYDYYNTSRRSDRKAIQILVYGVFVVELLQTALITHTCWVILISSWGELSGLVNTPWSSATTPVITGFVSSAVQCFFAWRVWQLSRSNVGRAVTVLIVSVAMMQLAASAAVTAEYVLLNRDYRRITSISYAYDTWLAGSLVCDSVIAIALVTTLAQAQRKSRFKSTETILNRLIINTIETGAITAGIALVELILFKLFPTVYYHVAIEYVLGRMYSNVLLATLNGRHRSRNTHCNAVNNFGTTNAEAGTELTAYFTTAHPSITSVGAHQQGVIISTTVATDAVNIYSQGKIQAI